MRCIIIFKNSYLKVILFLYFLLFFCFFFLIDIIARLEELCFNMMLKNMFIIQSKWPAAVTAEYCSPMSTL